MQGEENYIVSQFITPGPWTKIGNSTAQASVQFAYTLEGKQLVVNVNQGQMQLPEQGSVPVILFSGSFNYVVSGTDQKTRLASVGQIFKGWQQDLTAFRDIIETRFLSSGIPVGVPKQLVT